MGFLLSLSSQKSDPSCGEYTFERRLLSLFSLPIPVCFHTYLTIMQNPHFCVRLVPFEQNPYTRFFLLLRHGLKPVQYGRDLIDLRQGDGTGKRLLGTSSGISQTTITIRHDLSIL